MGLRKTSKRTFPKEIGGYGCFFDGFFQSSRASLCNPQSRSNLNQRSNLKQFNSSIKQIGESEMKFTRHEEKAIQEIVEVSESKEIVELFDLELAAVGGGMGDVTLS